MSEFLLQQNTLDHIDKLEREEMEFTMLNYTEGEEEGLSNKCSTLDFISTTPKLDILERKTGLNKNVTANLIKNKCLNTASRGDRRGP